MYNVLFLQSEVKNPFAFYSKMLKEHPLYYDRANAIWAAYTFDDCYAVLKNSTSYVPSGDNAFTTESIETKKVLQSLARLSNPPSHDLARKASVDLMSRLKLVDIGVLMYYLIGEPKKPDGIDWVNGISKKLPVLALLKGLTFSSTEIEIILPEVENLVKIMLPIRSESQNDSINRSIKKVLSIIDSYISRIYGLTNEGEIALYSSNLIGLLIQSFDAGRGLLCNALLQLLSIEQCNKNNINYILRSVKETLRFDPPVHNTRRVLTKSLIIQNQQILAGESILLVLAAANRDPLFFESPDTFNIFRSENIDYLTYGAGAHRCIAEYFSINLTASALHYIYSKYNDIRLQESEIQYEPRINVRLPVKMNLVLS